MTLLKLAQRIREEFEESPGLRVTIDEGARFWALDSTAVRSSHGEQSAAQC